MPVTGPVLSRNRTGLPGRFGACTGNGAGLEAALERKLLTKNIPILCIKSRSWEICKKIASFFSNPVVYYL